MTRHGPTVLLEDHGLPLISIGAEEEPMSGGQGIAGPGHLPGPFCSEDIHDWFGLTYANYQVLHRSLMQEMPPEWQHAFVALLEELREAFRGAPGDFMVKLRGDEGRFIRDPLANYRYPDMAAIEQARHPDD